MSKKPVQKLEPGMAYGSRTYGDMCRPKSGKPFNTHQLIDRAANRIVALLEKGARGEKILKEDIPVKHRQEFDDLLHRNKLAETPKLVQFAYWKSRLDELREELKTLEATNNERKISLNAPTIKVQIKEVEITMRELFDEIKKERRILERTTNLEEDG
jgi:hypothetical protein